jgi:non-ribosomal peptide synthetase component F
MGKKIDENLILFTPKFVEQKEYWVEKLAGNHTKTGILPDVNIFSNFHQSKATQKKVEIPIPGDLAGRLIKMGKQSDLSLYIILLTGLKTLIYRYTQNKDIGVISPLHKHTISEETINDRLLIRDRISDEITFVQFLLSIKQSVLDAYQNQDYPFDKLAEDFPGASSSIVCSLTNLHDRQNINQLPGQLAFCFERKDHLYRGSLVYDSTVYTPGHAGQISKHLVNLLENATRDVNIKISDISLLSQQEKERLILHFNNNKTFSPEDRFIWQLFEEHAEKTPYGTAIKFERMQITYRQLNERVNRLAWRLKERGIQRDSLVGILLNRSLLLAESILAVWKAGGAYIPLEVRDPGQRLMGILNDSQVELLMTLSQHVNEDIQSTAREKILSLEVPKEPLEKSKLTSPGLKGDIKDLAYVIYTSGSTGKPKGAMVEHIGMMNHIAAKVHDLQLSSTCVIAQNAPHIFDISVWQFFTALTLGGKTVIYPDVFWGQSKFLVDKEENETVETAVEAALAQIEEKKYVTELMERGIKNIKKLAVVFSGKDVYVKE